MNSKSVVFQIDQCDPVKAALKGEKCKLPGEIAEYVKDVQLDTWVSYSKMNFLDRSVEPIFKVNDIFASYLLNTKKDSVIDRNYMYLRRNNLQLEDDYT